MAGEAVVSPTSNLTPTRTCLEYREDGDRVEIAKLILDRFECGKLHKVASSPGNVHNCCECRKHQGQVCYVERTRAGRT